jgi:cysteine desulfurase
MSKRAIKKIVKSSKSTNKRTSKNTCSTAAYFDNNGTTLINEAAKKEYVKWISCYNASTSTRLAKPARKLLDDATDFILAHSGVSTATHTAVFTSGGTESNCLIIRSCVKAYKKKLTERGSVMRPHVILSAMEHPSIIKCINDLVDSGDIDASHVQPTIYGNILPSDVEKEILPQTCLITIMYANNEIPVINNIRAIGVIARARHIPMHSDCVQIFGKYRINIKKDNIDALSASGHKFYGPKGVGILIINNVLIEGYGLTGEINGSQQSGLRGGTENIAGIASFIVAVKTAFTRRNQKNVKLYSMRIRLLEKLEKNFEFSEFGSYAHNDSYSDNKPDLELVSIGPPEDKREFILPNTVLLAVCKNRGRPFCNIDLKEYLDKKGFVVSVGSACSTSNPKASHVMDSIGASDVIKRGVIRISFGDMNTMREVDRFVDELTRGIKAQCSDLED